MIDEVGASQMLLPENKRRKTVTLKDVEEIVAKIARIPPKIGLAPTTRRRCARSSAT